MRTQPPEPTRIEIEDRYLRCLHCSRDQFRRRRMRLETASTTGMQPDWRESAADVFLCAHCEFIHGFLAR